MGTDSQNIKDDLLQARREVGQVNVALAKANAQVDFSNGAYQYETRYAQITTLTASPFR